MKPGVYRHKQYPELLYLFIGLARNHESDEEVIVYIPLFTRPEWKGTARMTYRTVENFNSTFEWVDERIP